MTGEELKKYKQQIEALKKDFHKENPENIESKGISDKEIVKNKIGSVAQTTSNVVSNTSDKFSNKTNSFLDALKDADKTKAEIKTPVKEQVLDLTKETNFSSIEKKPEIQTKEVVKTQSEKVFEVKKEEVKDIKAEEKKETPPPPINVNNQDEDKKFPFIKWLLVILLMALLGFLAYYFLAGKKSENKRQNEIAAQEKIYKDSILEYENALAVKEELEEKYNEENLETISISDTIFNVTSRNPEGYYAIIGSYSELKNASILKTRQKTSFTSYIFEQTPIRIGLKLSENENEVFEDLDSVREKYPKAWVLYNKN